MCENSDHIKTLHVYDESIDRFKLTKLLIEHYDVNVDENGVCKCGYKPSSRNKGFTKDKISYYRQHISLNREIGAR